MRHKIIAGNWKMNCNRAEAQNLLRNLLETLSAPTAAQVVICPPYTALTTAADVFVGTALILGAQDVFWKDKGAYTGQISPQMLVEIGCQYVIVGHSERRGRFGVPEPDFDEEILAHFGDNDRTVNLKLHAALAAGLLPICCVGETLDERQAGHTDAIVTEQTKAALKGVTAASIHHIVFAYEPVWAIGTGEVCAADEADRVCGVIRAAVGAVYGPDAAETVRVQYGGSVKPDNAADLLSRPNIDGALVGGASLKAGDFAAIVAAAPQP
jgi:triosephosphate isomerase (TIM)